MVVMLCMGLYKALGIAKSSEKVFVLKTNSFMLLGSIAALIILCYYIDYKNFMISLLWGLSSGKDQTII